MNVDLLFKDSLDNPYLKNYLSFFKTSVWEKLSSDERVDVYDKINKFFCAALKIQPYTIEYDKYSLQSFRNLDENGYKSNIVRKENKVLMINNVYKNQYCTLYDYFYAVIADLQNKICKSKYYKYLDQDQVNKWKKDLYSVSFGEIKIDSYSKDDFAYSSMDIDARKYCANILVGIIKMNFDYSNAKDEETFMSSIEVLKSDKIMKLEKKEGNKIYKDNVNKQKVLSDIRDRVHSFRNKVDLGEAKDEDLFLVVYPGVNDCIDLFLLIKIYNEIIKRIYNESISINEVSKDIIINGNKYDYRHFRNNIFNIVLYECLSKMEEDLKTDGKFINSFDVKNKGLNKALIDIKKEWVLGVINRVDNSLSSTDFGVIKYRPLSVLLSQENLDSYLEETTLNKTNKRRK